MQRRIRLALGLLARHSQLLSRVIVAHADPLVPVEHALQLAVTLPRCRMFFDPDEGHHFFRRRLPRILALLVGRQTRAAEPVAR